MFRIICVTNRKLCAGDFIARLSEIARAYGVSQSVIARENNISDPAKIRVGQILLIPAP